MNAVRPVALALCAIGVLCGFTFILYHLEPLRWLARVSFAAAVCIAMPVAVRRALQEGYAAAGEVRALRDHQPLQYWGIIVFGIGLALAAFSVLGLCMWYAPWN
jgi:hypothetical protein